MIEKYYGVSALHICNRNAGVLFKNDRSDELISDPAQKGVANRRSRIERPLSFGVHEHSERTCGPLPVPAAVHSEESSAKRSNASDADVRHLDLESFDIISAVRGGTSRPSRIAWTNTSFTPSRFAMRRIV